MAALWPSLWLCQSFDVSILEANSYTFSRRVDLPYTFLVAGNHSRDATKMIAVVTNAESFSLLTRCFRMRWNCKNTYEILDSRIPNEAITILPANSASNLLWVWYRIAIESEPSPLRREAQSDPA